jgi:hypothetical protein
MFFKANKLILDGEMPKYLEDKIRCPLTWKTCFFTGVMKDNDKSKEQLFH